MQRDIWGLCPDCERWFRCERWFDRSAPQPVCDRCGREPIAIENRARARGHAGIVPVPPADVPPADVASPPAVT